MTSQIIERRLSKNNKSGFRGVSKYRTNDQWVSTIKIDGKPKHLGVFDTPELAYEAYRSKFVEVYGCEPKVNDSEFDASNYDRQRRINLRLRVIENYGEVCECCGESTPEFLTIDHINGGGRKHRESLSEDIYIWLERNNFPKDEFRLLCYNCNCCIGHYGVCAHAKEQI